MSITVYYQRIHPKAILPTRAHEDDAGYDLYAVEPCEINPGERRLIDTGLAIAIPEGYYGRIAPRSGLALKNGIDVLAGVCDSSYRGLVGVILINLSPVQQVVSELDRMVGVREKFRVNPGDRIAQIIFEKCHTANWWETKTLPPSLRDKGGFGSSGVK